MMDQDLETITTMTTLENVYSAVNQVINVKGKDIHRLPASTGRVIEWLMINGYNVSGLDN